MGIDSFLNIAIPVGIVLWFGFIIYKGVQEQADAFGRWIVQTFRDMTQKGEENYRDVIIYE